MRMETFSTLRNIKLLSAAAATYCVNYICPIVKHRWWGYLKKFIQSTQANGSKLQQTNKKNGSDLAQDKLK